MFVIDGYEYNGTSCIVDGLTENFTLVEGFSPQRKQDGTMWYDVLGTETSHTVTLRRSPELLLSEWEELWEILKKPVDYHTFTFPNGENSTITYKGHITNGSRALEFNANGSNYWGDYTITIVPVEMQEVSE